MPTPSEAALRVAVRYLANIDTRHRFLKNRSDGWFDRTGLIILTERAGDGTPLVGVMLKYPAPCPADKTANMWIKYWLANLDRKADLPAAFKANIQAIYGEMVRVGATRVWGLVPKDAPYFVTLLDPIATAAKCTKIDGATVIGDEDFGRGNFFFGDGSEVNTEVQA